MRNSEIRTTALKKSMGILPSYEVIGFYEKAAPIYVVKLKCEITSADKFPIVHDTLLRLLQQEMSIEVIPQFLGLDETPEIVTKAWMDLASSDIINHRTNKLTDSGRLYLSENRLEMNKQMYFTIEIDGITGEYGKNRRKLVSTKNLAGQNITELYMNTSQPAIEYLKKGHVRELFNKNCDDDMKDKNQKISDILSIENINVDYRRVNCVVLRKGDNDFKVVTFDRNIPLPNYDSPLEDEINGENTLANILINDYLADDSMKLSRKLGLSLEKIVNDEFVKDTYDNLIFDATRSIILIVPIMSYSMLKDDIIDTLLEKSKRGVKIELYLSGNIDGSDSFQQKQISKLAAIKIDNFKIGHIPNYMENIVYVDSYKGLLIDYRKVNLSGAEPFYVIDECGAEISQENFKVIEKRINQFFADSNVDIYKYTSNEQLRQDIKEIINALYPLESFIRNQYGLFIRNSDSDEFSEIANALQSNLAKDEGSFKNFTSNLNKLLYESIQNRNYIFFKKIKHDYPKIFKAIDRNRIYRNSIEHRKLDPRQAITYKAYLLEDLQGRSPLLVDGGYLILQGKIIQYLREAICGEIPIK